MVRVESVRGREILDSRGRPTVLARVRFACGAVGDASVPSGASTGAAEAHELRDGDPSRYRGLGCRKAVASIDGPIARQLVGRDWAGQSDVDRALIDGDGTVEKSCWGANAILAVSIAFARAAASSSGVPLHAHLASLVPAPRSVLPRLTINLFSGGKHAGQQVAIQDVLIVPLAGSIDECLAMAFDVYQAAADLTRRRYAARPLRADEGGLAPPFPSTDAMLGDAADAVRSAGLTLGRDLCLAVDVAASHFREGGLYHVDDDRLDSAAMIDRIARWTRDFGLVSVEDGLSESDWEHWPELCRTIAPAATVIGDDLLCTNRARVERAAQSRAANGLLLKVNQIGTLTEAADARRAPHDAGWQITVSARSGETEDDWLADLAVAWGDQIKVGSITQSERLAKYNRLLEIERETRRPLHAWPARVPS